MNNKKLKIITIVIFFSILILPNISYIFLKNIINNRNTENRILTKKPEFSVYNLKNYFTEYSKYYDDNLPYRAIIKETYSTLDYLLLNSTTHDVVSGKNGWLFYDKTGNSPLRNVQGKDLFSDNDLESAKKLINDQVKKASEKGIKFYYLFAPNKENIYREYLPDYIKIYDDKSNKEKLIDYVNSSNVIYPKNSLLEAKKDYQLYYKQDTHWNELGAFFGYKAVIKAIKNDDVQFSSVEYIRKDNYGDLIGISTINGCFYDNIPTVNYNYTKSVNVPLTLTEYDNPNAKYNQTIMIVGDSYRIPMIKYFTSDFKKVIEVYTCNYSEDLIDKYNPNIVILEYVERGFGPGLAEIFK